MMLEIVLLQTRVCKRQATIVSRPHKEHPYYQTDRHKMSGLDEPPRTLPILLAVTYGGLRVELVLLGGDKG